MTMIPKFEPLEDRIVLDGADPEVSISGGGLQLGQQDVEYTLTFDNVGTESGYKPFVDLIIPSSGDDGDDGPTFDSASFLGGSITTSEVTFDAAGEAEHPFLLNPDGTAFIVTGGDEGDTLVVFELPYGSFSPGNPAVDIVFTLDYSQNAELTETPTLEAFAGFALGCDALDNPADDAPVRDTTPTTLTETPDLFTLAKSNNVPEAEAATGPSYVYQYTLSVDVAPGQSLDNFTLTDVLPPEIVYVGNPVISGGVGGTLTTQPPLMTQVTAPDNQLVVDFTEVSGSVSVTFDYYISNDPSDSASPTNSPTSGAQTPVVNELTGTGTWNPVDGDDTQNQSVSASVTDTISASTLAVQKSVAVAADNNAGGASPGDVYEFTLEVQVSDYFTFGDLEITDVLGDGWVYQAGSATFSTSEESATIGSTAFGANEDDDFDVTTGETTLTFNLSEAMFAAGQDRFLTGDIAGDGASSGTQTTATITYRASIADSFVDTGTGEQEVSQGDTLSNSVEISGTVRDNDTPTITNDTVVNTSDASVEIARGEIREKTVFALNGVTSPPPGTVVAAGDTVTFSIIYDAPQGAFENLNVIDNLPQLVFDSTELTTFDATPADNTQPPPAGVAYFGALDTFSGAGGTPPMISTVAADNQINFDFGDLTLATRTPIVVHLLFTVTIEDADFASDLFLTNQATATETNTTGDTISSTAIAQFDYAEPDLSITKGVIASDSLKPETALTGDTGPAASLPATAPGSAGFRFADPINSNDLAVTPVDGDIDNVDAGDLVSFAIVLENSGAAPNGAFNVTLQDTLPDGFEIPPGGLNLNISDGNGTAIPFTGLDGVTVVPASDLFTTGILLTDDAALEGSVSVFDETSGENVVVVTYDLLVSEDVNPAQIMTNTATLASYNSFEQDGNPFDGNGPLNRAQDDDTDDASANVLNVDITKTVDQREFEGDVNDRNGIGAGAPEVIVGEDIEFLIRVDLPEGELLESVISDVVDRGNLQLVSATIETIGAGITNTGGLSATDTATVTDDGSGNDTWSFDFDTITVPGDNDLTNNFIEIRVVANVPDATGDTANTLERNTARIDFENADGDELNASDAASVRVIEPNLTIGKTALPDVVAAGGVANYEVTIDNVAGSRDAPAYDLVISDTLDADLTLDPTTIEVDLNGVTILDAGTQSVTIGGQTYSITTPVGANANSFEIFADVLDPSDELVIRYAGDVSATVASDKTLPNTANLIFDSTPEDDSGADTDDREYTLSASADVETQSPEIDKSVVPGSTSYDETAGSELGIGETLTYEFVVFIPEGVISDVVVFDELPTGLEYVTSEVVRIGSAANTNISGATLNVGDTASVAGQRVEFDFGDLTNAQDGVRNTSDEIVVRVTARVTDAAGNVDAATITNTSNVSYTDGDGGTSIVSESETITVVEPDMSIDKSVVPVTADAGDTVSYTITATNDGNGPAYDMVITDDVVGPEVVADQGSLNVVLRDDLGAIFTPVEAPSFSFDGSGALRVVVPDLPADHVVIITYDAVVQDTALFSTAYTNTAEIARYDSNPAGTDTVPAGGAEDERSYTGPSDTADVTTTDASVAKEFFSSGDVNTSDPAGGANAQLTIGETVTYELTVSVPQGTADLVLSDNLPAGLIAQSAVVVSVGDDVNDTAGLSAGDTEANAGITINAARNVVSFDFGTVVIEGADDAAAGTTEIVVRVTSIVDDVPAASDGLQITNTARLDVTDPNTGTALQPPATGTETIDVVEPEIDFQKTGEVAGDKGDTVTYTITATNTGDAAAYDVLVSDPFSDPNLTFEPGSATVAIDGVALVVQPTIIIPAPSATGGFAFDGLTILPGEVLTVTFDGRIAAGAPTAESFINTSSIAYDSVPGDPVDADGNPIGRDYSDSDSHSVATSPGVTKTPFTSGFSETASEAGDTPFDLNIGETVTFRYELTLPEIAFDNVSVTDLLPPGLEFVSVSVVDVNGTAAAGTVTATPDGGNPNLITLDFGAMTNASDGSIGDDDVLIFDLVARVTNDGVPDANDTLTNTITLNADPAGDDPFGPVQATADVRVVEPELTIDKTGPLAISAGSSGDFEIVVTNVGVAGAEGPAYDVDIADTLPPGLELDPGSLVYTDSSGAVITPTTQSTSLTSFSARFDVLDVGDFITVSYSAELGVTAAPLTTFENTATADFFSAPSDLLDGGGNPVAEDYAPVSDTHRFSSGPTLEKDATGSGFTETPEDNDADTVQDVTIGETVTFDLILTLPEIAMDSVVLSDDLPVGLSFVSAEVTAVGSEISVDGDTSVGDVNAGASFVSSGQNLTVTFDDVINSYVDGTITQGQDAIVVQINARVQDVAAVLDGGTLTNNADLTVTPQGETAMTPVTADETIEIVNPDLSVDKTSTVAVNPGDTVDYQVVVRNDGTSTAYDVSFADTFGDAALTLVPGSVTVDLDAVDITGDLFIDEISAAAGDGFTFDLIDTGTTLPFEMPIGSTLTITYQAVLDINAPEAQTFPNTAEVRFDNLPGDPVDGGGNPIDGRDYTATDDAAVATVPFITKTPTASNFAETDSVLGSDPFDLAIGEEVTYTYELYLPEIAMSSVIFADDLPPGLEFISLSVDSYGAGMTNGGGGAIVDPATVFDPIDDSQFTLDFGSIINPADGSIGADDVITLTVVARVTDEQSAGDTLTNETTLAVIPDGAPALAVAENSADIRVVEPELEQSKTGPIALDPGDTGAFTITLENSGPAVTPSATGPAYDVEMVDVLPADMTLDTGSIVITLNGAPYTPGAGELTATATGFTLQFDVLEADDLVVVTYNATLDVGAAATSAYTNTVTTEYDSAPGEVLDGSGDPIEKTYTPVVSQHSVASQATIEKTSIASGFAASPEDTDGDMIRDLTLGETTTFELVVTLPEIPMDRVVLTDLLPTGLTFVSAELSEVGSAITVDGSGDLATVRAGLTTFQAGQLFTFQLDDVVNTDTDGIGTRGVDTLIFEVTARVDTIASNTGAAGGTQLTNTAGLTITPEGIGPLATVNDTETVEVVEPVLDLDKTADITGDRGAETDYTITVTNSGNGAAFDAVISDPLSDPFLTLGSTPIVVRLDGVLITPTIVTPATGGSDGFSIPNLTILPGEVLQITVPVLIEANTPDAVTLTNTADVIYDGVPGDPVDENGDPIVDRDLTDNDSHAIATSPGIDKVPFASNLTETDSTLGDDPFDLAIGETVTYRYTLTLPEINMDSVIVTDLLPTGLEFVSATVINVNGTGAAGTVTATPDGGNPNLIELDFGAANNASDGTIGVDDQLVFEVQARVSDDGTSSAGQTKTNTASLVVDPAGDDPFAAVVDTADVRIVEPALDINKTGPFAINPGDFGDYQITVSNVGRNGAAGPAYDVDITDTLPASLILDTGSVVVSVDGIVVAPTSIATAATGFTIEFDVIDADAVVTIDYRAQLDPGVAAVTGHLNTATALFSSAPSTLLDGGGGPAGITYPVVTDVHNLSTIPTLEKTAISTGYAQTDADGDGDGTLDLVVGETVTYALELILPEIPMDVVTLTDTLPDGLEFVSAEVTFIGSEITINGATNVSAAGQVVTISLTNVFNTYVDDTVVQSEDGITIELTARVADVAAATDGAELTNRAGLVVTPEGGPALNEIVATDTVEIVEPDVTITKTTEATEPFLGDIISYTVVVGNEDTASSPAFNSVVTDRLPAGLELAGAPVLSDPTLGSVSPTSIEGSDALIITIPILQPGQTLTIEYEVFVGYTTNVVDPVQNTATIASSSSPDANDGFGRSYAPTDSASIVARPVPDESGDRSRDTHAINGIDDAQFFPVLLIDPIFSGTAEPGSNVTINLYRSDGSLDYVRNVVSDAGGHWIAIFPRTELASIQDDFSTFHETSVLFDEPVRLLDDTRTDGLNLTQEVRTNVVGSDLADQAYTLGIAVDRPSSLPDAASLHNTRIYFAPSHVGEIYGRSDSLDVSEVFDDVAFRTVSELYDASSDPLGVSLNRFNYEFLGGATAVPGAQ